MVDVVIPESELHAILVDAFCASRTSPANAKSVADALIAAELAGQGGHGLRRVAAYTAQVRAGKVDGYAVPVATQVRPGTVSIDAARGFAYPAIDMAIENLAKMAPRTGICMAGIFRSHHAGVAGVAVERLAEKGLIAIMVANAPAAMAPWGGKKALYGTDPIAFAAPVEGGDPIVVDISLSKVARGKIMAAAQAGEPIPEGWALDKDGRPTTDAQEALQGTMVPLGDAKGTALALMVELLCAGLTGANYGYEATSYFDDQGENPGTGQAIIAIDPAGFGSEDRLSRFAEMAREVEESQGARLPGRRRQALREDLRNNGIKVPADLLETVRLIGSSEA